MTTKHTTAIHVLKSKLRMTDDDYRALLHTLTGVHSTTLMTDAQRSKVRDHMQRLDARMNPAKASTTATGTHWRQRYASASPEERKVWAMWNALKRAGAIDDNSERSLNAWVQRTVHVDALRFCTTPQLTTLIEALKEWTIRVGAWRTAAPRSNQRRA